MIAPRSQIVVTADFEGVAAELRRRCAEEGMECLVFLKEGNFLVSDAQEAIEKAYLASGVRQILVLGADQFSEVVQNKLLKVIEEPPPNKEFVLLFRSKAQVLPTIRSRLPLVHDDRGAEEEPFTFDVAGMDIRSVYETIQVMGRFDKATGKRFLERTVTEAIRCGRYDLDERSLDLFRDAVRALDLGSPPPFVVTGVLLKLLARRKRRDPTA
ncbi:DNA polymerase III subunit delta' [Nitratifractor sp.]